MELKITLKECVAKDEKLESVTKNISSLENELFAKEEIVCQQEAELEQLHVALSLVTKKHSEQDAPCEVDEEYEVSFLYTQFVLASKLLQLAQTRIVRSLYLNCVLILCTA